MFSIRYTFDEIVQLVRPSKIQGTTEEMEFTGIASLAKANRGDISFLGNLKYKAEVFASKASLILVPNSYIGSPRAGQVFLMVENPSRALDMLLRDILNKVRPPLTPGIHPTAIIDPTAQVSPEAYVGPLCNIGAHSVIGPRVNLVAQVFVGQHVTIGEDTTIRPHCTLLDDTEIGKRCFLDPGVVLGSEGFGYETEKGIHERSPQLGRVVLEDDVDIGANTTVDRARFEETRIGEGTKIDNLVQIAHNVIIGKHCFIVAFVGISGSTHIGDYSVIAGQVGLAGHLNIGNHVTIGAQSGVTHDLEDNSFVRGTPAAPYMLAHRVDVLKKRLPELFKRVDDIEKTFAYLTNKAAKTFLLPQPDLSQTDAEENA